jgi:hypothetical protein
MELNQAHDIGTKAFFMIFDKPIVSARVENNSATELATKSNV